MEKRYYKCRNKKCKSRLFKILILDAEEGRYCEVCAQCGKYLVEPSKKTIRTTREEVIMGLGL